MNDENKKNEVLRKLKYFLDNKIQVHISELDGTFYNGLLKDLVDDEGLVVIVDRKNGMTILFAENININSIAEFKEEKS